MGSNEYYLFCRRRRHLNLFLQACSTNTSTSTSSSTITTIISSRGIWRWRWRWRPCGASSHYCAFLDFLDAPSSRRRKWNHVTRGQSSGPSTLFDFDLSSRLHLSSASTATPQPQPPYPSLSTHQAASRHAARRHTASRHTASKHAASRHAAAYAAARVQNFAAGPPAPHCKSPHLRGNVLLTDQSVGMVPPIMPGQPREVFDLTGDDDDVAIKNEPTVKTEPSIKTESSGQGGSSPLVPAPNRLEWLFGNFKHALNTMPNYQVYQLWYL